MAAMDSQRWRRASAHLDRALDLPPQEQAACLAELRAENPETADDVQPEWLANCETLGVTAGTSTPDDVIDAVETRLREIAREHEMFAVAK